MDFFELVRKTRSCRRFDETRTVDPDTMRMLVEHARLVPSGANVQPLKYVGVCSPEWNAKVFSTLAWAGYLTDWPGPAEGERPTAYIIVCTDTALRQEAAIVFENYNSWKRGIWKTLNEIVQDPQRPTMMPQAQNLVFARHPHYIQNGYDGVLHFPRQQFGSGGIGQ